MCCGRKNRKVQKGNTYKSKDENKSSQSKKDNEIILKHLRSKTITQLDKSRYRKFGKLRIILWMLIPILSVASYSIVMFTGIMGFQLASEIRNLYSAIIVSFSSVFKYISYTHI